jgi:hypothetical protein
MNKILRSIFKIWNFLPLFQMLFLWLNKTPPKWNSPLSVQEGFKISILIILLSPPFEHNMIPIRNLSIENHTNWKTLFKIRWWCSPFALGSYSLPLWHESPKTEPLEPLELLSPPLIINKWVKIIPEAKSFCLGLMLSPSKMESCPERRRRMSYGVEAFVFAEDSNSPFNIPMTWFEIDLKTH